MITLNTFDRSFADQLKVTKAALIDDLTVCQLGARSIAFRSAPAWPDGPGMAHEAIIETFMLTDSELMPLSDAPWLERWKPRAQAMADTVLSACQQAGITLSFPGYITCSITPVDLLLGDPHLDDDQFNPSAGIGIVAISGQHRPPRVADQPLRLTAPVAPGPLPLEEAGIEAFRAPAQLPSPTDADKNDDPDHIVIFGQFGQLHAGPSRTDMPGEATHRQLMVLRVATTSA